MSGLWTEVDRLEMAVLVAALGAGGFAGQKGGKIRKSIDWVISGGRRIELERFLPDDEAKHPAVVLVHGADGLQFDHWIRIYHNLAMELAGAGYATLLAHYFDRTATKFGDGSTNSRHFTTWMETISETVTYATKLTGVDANRVGLVGVSLGAYLSIAVGTVDKRVRAIVDLFGGLPETTGGVLKKMPPVLILHGDADGLVPVREAYRLEQALMETEQPYEMMIYPGQGHGFTGESRVDAQRRTEAFLGKHLKTR